MARAAHNRPSPHAHSRHCILTGTASLLGLAARGAARLLTQKVSATSRRVYIGAGMAALVMGMGASTLLLQIERHPTSLLARVAHFNFPTSANTGAPAATVPPVTRMRPQRRSRSSARPLPLRPAAAGKSRATKRRRLKTSSIGPAAAPDQIGALLRDGPSTADRAWCALPRSRSRSSVTRSSPPAPKTAPPGALFAILSARTGWPRQLKSARKSSNNLWRLREVDPAPQGLPASVPTSRSTHEQLGGGVRPAIASTAST